MKGRVAALAVVLLAAPFVVTYEAVVQKRYIDPVGIATACVGETDKEVVNFKAHFTRDECIAVMGASLMAHAVELDKCVKVPLARHEAGAILSLSYNIGVSAFCKSTLARLLNTGEPPAVWCKQIHRWVYAGGIKLRGLVKRREAEYQMCVGNV